MNFLLKSRDNLEAYNTELWLIIDLYVSMSTTKTLPGKPAICLIIYQKYCFSWPWRCGKTTQWHNPIFWHRYIVVYSSFERFHNRVQNEAASYHYSKEEIIPKLFNFWLSVNKFGIVLVLNLRYFSCFLQLKLFNVSG